MDDLATSGKRILIGFIVVTLLLAVATISINPAGQRVPFAAVAFFVLLLLVMAGLYQGRPLPKIYTIVLMLVAIGASVWALVTYETTALSIGVSLLFCAFCLSFAGVLLFSKRVAAFLTWQQEHKE